MSVYVSLACRSYIEGRICLTSDRLGGFITNHGFCSVGLWKNVLEWTAQKYPNELIRVGVVESFSVPTIDYLSAFGQVSYQLIDTEYIATNSLSEFDLLYFIGLPLAIDSSIIEQYVRNGGGVLIECPDQAGSINILDGIETINITSIERPSYGISYWTNDGTSHPIFSSDAHVYFYSTLNLDSLSNWTILMSSAQNNAITNSLSGSVFVPTIGSSSSEIGFSYENYYKDGIVSIDESFSDGVAFVSSHTYQHIGNKVYSAKTIDRMYGVFTSDVIMASSSFLNWNNLTWDGTWNIHSKVSLFARSSDTQDDLVGEKWNGPYLNPSNDISSLNGKYLQFMAVLRNDYDNEIVPVVTSISLSFLAFQQSTKFFTETFQLNFVPKSILLTYNASNISDDTIIKFAVSGEDTADFTQYQFIDPNKIESLNLAYGSKQIKVMLEFVGNSSVSVVINEFAMMIGGDTVEAINVVSNVAPVAIQHLITEDEENDFITEDEGYHIITE